MEEKTKVSKIMRVILKGKAYIVVKSNGFNLTINGDFSDLEKGAFVKIPLEIIRKGN